MAGRSRSSTRATRSASCSHEGANHRDTERSETEIENEEMKRHFTTLLFSVSLFSVSSVPLWFIPFSRAQPTAETRGPPRVLVAAPLGVTAGKRARVTLRGLRFTRATEVRCHHPKVTVKMLGPPATVAGVSATAAEELGDATVDVEVTVPDDAAPEVVTLSVVTPMGESPPHKLLVDDAQVIAEKEPNDGFRTAQPLTVPATVSGAIQAAQDVDVFRFEGRAGQSVICEVLANRLGSPLDATRRHPDAVRRPRDRAGDGRRLGRRPRPGVDGHAAEGRILLRRPDRRRR
jgi:hypothetical protein